MWKGSVSDTDNILFVSNVSDPDTGTLYYCNVDPDIQVRINLQFNLVPEKDKK